jgi:exopolysaccharide production protein ExoQ
MTSSALWVPLLWLLILSSRNVSEWFGGGLRVEKPGDYLEGSPFDRNIYLLLIAFAAVVLGRRQVNWRVVLGANIWLVLLMGYYGLSCVWSDFPFVAVKRWIKDVGNVLMVLIVCTEASPIAAIRALFARTAYVLLPASVLVIKFYGDLGRYMSATWESMFRGVATEKNSLGCLALFSGLFIVWDYLYERRARRLDWAEKGSRVFLLLMVIWLLKKADSSTADVCLLLGSGLAVILGTQFGRAHIRRLGMYLSMGLAVIMAIYFMPEIFSPILDLLGEDITLTGRTDLWAELLKQPINPLMGTGYQSFWLGDRAEHFWAMWNFRPNQAHNGWLETYLNGGLIAVILLCGFLFSSGRAFKTALTIWGSDLQILLFSLFTVCIFYNLTEAMFNRMSPIWFFLILASFCARLSRQVPAPSNPVTR